MQSASKQPQKLPRLIVALGAGQIIAWASSYYLLAILALPMSRSTGWIELPLWEHKRTAAPSLNALCLK